MKPIGNKLYDILLEIEQSAAVDILLGALEEMQGYNGQTITDAIYTVIDAENTDDGCIIPSVSDLNARFA